MFSSIRQASSYQADQSLFMKKARHIFKNSFWNQGLPVLGICYGMQALTHASVGRSVLRLSGNMALQN